jgi:hypothetical protein
VTVNELTATQVTGMNRRAIENANARIPGCQQQHRLVRSGDLDGCLAGIFYQSATGYMHLPLEKMAGLLLHRIAEGQFFFDGNKRTALAATLIFLQNHGLKLRLPGDEIDQLLWGFAKGSDGSPAKYGEDDAVKFILDNILPRT